MERNKYNYTCKICGYPKGEKGIRGFLFASKEEIITHIKDRHPKIAKDCEE